ncbi:unnamed protein product [Periconia digitata]|uniref:Histone deacetylase n=1 Tax=Periconia digitata TaxID=1303443 RepID=A0A9W4UBC5_9PLEO|nr:unnamed protein product [Periconia digitata]
MATILGDEELADEDDIFMNESILESTEAIYGGNPATINPATMLTKPPDFLTTGKSIYGDSGDTTKAGMASKPSLITDSLKYSSDSLPDDVPSFPEPMEVVRASAVRVIIPPPPRFPPLPYSSNKTGLVYDAKMKFHAESSDAILEDGIHPEDPRRISEIFNEIQQAGLVQGADDLDEDAADEQCWRILARPASEGEICLIHTPKHYHFIASLQNKQESELKNIADQHDSIYFHNSTFLSATLAAGGAIEACRAVVRGDVRNAIAIIRPPGHHAESDQPSGFCIFNNVPIAARVCQNDFPDKCRKIMILDWDVHHGNGVQHAFYDDPNVLYVSLHVFRGGNFYPNLPDGDLTYCGEGAGLGRNVNIPWEDHGMGDAEYLYAFQEVVMPIATEFDPDLIIISAGFDAAEGDLLGGCHVTPACYAHMTHMLMRVAEGKVAVCLEGGYNLRSIARSALAVTRTLMLQPPERLEQGLSPKPSAVQTVSKVKQQHSRYWKCLFPKQLDRTGPALGATKRMHNVIREWQSHELSQEHCMIPLMINNSGLAETFQHEVVATPDFMGRHPLLVVFHDPPAVTIQPDPVTGRTELHNMWLTDSAKDYIDWAVENDFEVIDVNIPKVVFVEDDDGGYVSANDPEVRIQQAREVAAYIWENYIEPHEATQVFFMGVGTAYLGLVDLLGTHENCTDDESVVECLIGFLSDTTLQSIKRPTDDNIGNWYYAHSLIFVEHDHPVWDPIRNRKQRRKWGKLLRSDKSTLGDMLSYHQPEVKEYILNKRKEFEQQEMRIDLTTDYVQEDMKSPPLHTRTPGMPPLGLFSVSPNPHRVATASPRP